MMGILQARKRAEQGAKCGQEKLWMVNALGDRLFLPRSPRGSWHEPAGSLIAGARGGGLDALAGGALKQSCGVESLGGDRLCLRHLACQCAIREDEFFYEPPRPQRNAMMMQHVELSAGQRQHPCHRAVDPQRKPQWVLSWSCMRCRCNVSSGAFISFLFAHPRHLLGSWAV
jgi:hypothetical protein